MGHFEDCIKQLDIMIQSMWDYVNWKIPEGLDESLHSKPVLYEITETGKKTLNTFKNAWNNLNRRLANFNKVDKPVDVIKANNLTFNQNKETRNFYGIGEGLDDKHLDIYYQLDNEDKTIIKDMWKKYIESVKDMNLKISIYNGDYPKDKINLLELK